MLAVEFGQTIVLPLIVDVTGTFGFKVTDALEEQPPKVPDVAVYVTDEVGFVYTVGL